eukprot:scaffold243752_cov44-Tisochrysis_lutea.AAC.1
MQDILAGTDTAAPQRWALFSQRGLSTRVRVHTQKDHGRHNCPAMHAHSTRQGSDTGKLRSHREQLTEFSSV